LTKGRILLADDNRLVVKVTTAILEKEGYAVSVAWDGIEAIKKVYTERPDLVILDIEMPKVNGYQVCRLLKDDEYTKDIPIIMLTGRERQSDMFWGLQTGADAYMVKGFEPERLLSVVRERMENSKRKTDKAFPDKEDIQVDDESGLMRRIIDVLDKKLFQSTILNKIGSLMAVTEDYRQVIKGALEILTHVIGNPVGLVILFDEGEEIVNIASPVSVGMVKVICEIGMETAVSYGWEPKDFDSVNNVMFGEDLLRTDKSDVDREMITTAHIPLVSRKKVFGILLLASQEDGSFSAHAGEVLKVVGGQLTMLIDNARLYDSMKKLAITDGLTKTFNHRFFHELLEREWRRAERYNSVFSLMMLDIDDFKGINDTYGHLCGDELLKELARLLKGNLRATDVVARYGGEEFAIILPETSGDEASVTAERVRKAVEEHVFIGDESGLKITVSIGISSYPAPGLRDRSDLIRRADNALYDAKRARKNRVCLFEEESSRKGA